MVTSSKKNKDVAGVDRPAGTAASAAPSPDAKRMPLKTIREEDVSASIWSRELLVQMDRRTFYSITFERSYRVPGGPWKYSKSFDFGDLPKLVKVAQQAEEFILGLMEQGAN